MIVTNTGTAHAQGRPGQESRVPGKVSKNAGILRYWCSLYLGWSLTNLTEPTIP